MSSSRHLVERFRTAVDLWQTGIIMQRQRLRRAHPDATPEEIERS